jgi:purine nucleosidase
VIKPRAILIAILLAAVRTSMATRWDIWRTGREALAPLAIASGGPGVALPGRIWIDTDAARAAAARTDLDDCLAILWLVSRRTDIAGVSTSFGNASGDVAADRVAALMAQLLNDGLPVPPVFRGNGERLATGGPQSPGVAAMQAALEAGPLTILALGPLTNLAAALKNRPDLQRNVTRIVAVMGHRPGHLFHPTEGKGTGALFGHGPIFPDLNVAVDPDAVPTILSMHLPMTLIPYDAARATLITAADLDSLARRNPAHHWVVQTARDWPTFWNDDVGLPGFYPFDWIAAANTTSR